MAGVNSLPGFRRVGILAFTGALLTVIAWLWPAHWKSVPAAAVERAGRGTLTVVELGLMNTAAEQAGPARLLLAAAQTVRAPERDELAAALVKLSARKPELAAWGGGDSRLEKVIPWEPAAERRASVPVLEMFLPEPARAGLRQYLSQSRSPGVRVILETRKLAVTRRFVPAARPGGQPFEATILLLGFLCEGEYVSGPFAQEVKTLAARAAESGISAEWEKACLELLALGRRLNWTQLVELIRSVPDLKTLATLARIAQTAPERFPIVYSAAVLTQSPAGVAAYWERYPEEGGAHLATALAQGQGAVQLLIQRQLPISPPGAEALAFAAPLVVKSPGLALVVKLAGFILAIGCFYRVWNELSAIERVEGLSILSPLLRLRRGGWAILLVVLLMVASEPYIFGSGGSPGELRLSLPTLSNSPVPPPSSRSPQPRSLMNLDLSTLLSIAVFAAMQVIVYAACLMKIHEIDRQSASPQLKLKLMENEENLFDSGLYVGIAGTATALVLQVLQIIEANLLAAYSANLFGILCVAIVKIRHVRAYKRKLILQSQPKTPVIEPLVRPLPAV